MASIASVEIVEFAYDLPDIGMDDGGQNISYRPGARHRCSSYAVRIMTADGATGEYVAMWGGTPMALAQTVALAPLLIGRDPGARERIFDPPCLRGRLLRPVGRDRGRRLRRRP